MNVHDALFKATFSQVEHAADLIRRNLPPEIVARMDFTTLALCTGSFVDEVLKERYTDLLFSIEIEGSTAFIYLLYEHQSGVDALMPFRLLRYTVRIWETFLTTHPDRKRLPAIVSVVVHHSATGWTEATAFDSLLDLDAQALSALGDYVPRLRFVLDDLSVETNEALHARAMSALGRLVFLCLKNSRTPEELLKSLRGWVDLVREVRHSAHGVAALIRIWRYILAVSERLESEQVLQQLAEAVGEDGKEEVVTAANQLREEGRKEGHKEGRKEGHKEGHKEGLQEGQRKTLLKLLGVKFGPLPGAVVARVSAANPVLLDQWTERVLTASSLAEVLGESGP